MSMTPEQQRTAIAEACGWVKDFTYEDFYTGELKQAWTTPDGHGVVEIPNYVFDLNAMHEAEKVLSIAQRKGNEGYLHNLFVSSTWDLAHATAAKRAEAFLRTIGKWEESCQ